MSTAAFLTMALVATAGPLLFVLAWVWAIKRQNARLEEEARYPAMRRYVAPELVLALLFFVALVPNVIWETLKDHGVSGPARHILLGLQLAAVGGLLWIEVLKKREKGRTSP